MKSVSNNQEIKVIGNGVSGLTTAIALLDAGYHVSILTKDHFEDTVSAKAAAIWFPYSAKPIDKVNLWSKISFQKFKELAVISGSGVSFVPFDILEPLSNPPFWLDALPDEAKTPPEQTSVLSHSFYKYCTKVPLIETQIYLPYLKNRFLKDGGTIEVKEIDNLNLISEKDFVINCTGLASKVLCNDDELFPIKGQIIKVEPSKDLTGMSIEEPYEENEQELTYIIPRSDCTVLGGSAYKNDGTQIIDSDLNNRILSRCLEVYPKLASKKVISYQTGLRPGRTQIRLEKDSKFPVIHNYGHGGAGFTVSWGCANEVLNLVKKYTENE